MALRWSLLLPLVAALVLALCLGFGGPASSTELQIVVRAAEWRQSSPLLTSVPAALTQLGNAYVLLPLAGVLVVTLYAVGRRRSALLLFVLVAGERLALDGLKILVERPRPQVEDHPVFTHSFSFPSGHAANTMTVLVAVALFVLPASQRRWTVPLAIALAALVGVTRPWLGVHWPSDVIAGWMLAALSIAAALWARRHFNLRD